MVRDLALDADERRKCRAGGSPASGYANSTAWGLPNLYCTKLGGASSLAEMAQTESTLRLAVVQLNKAFSRPLQWVGGAADQQCPVATSATSEARQCFMWIVDGRRCDGELQSLRH